MGSCLEDSLISGDRWNQVTSNSCCPPPPPKNIGWFNFKTGISALTSQASNGWEKRRLRFGFENSFNLGRTSSKKYFSDKTCFSLTLTKCHAWTFGYWRISDLIRTLPIAVVVVVTVAAVVDVATNLVGVKQWKKHLVASHFWCYGQLGLSILCHFPVNFGLTYLSKWFYAGGLNN